jgi:hypothetical protein
MTAPVSMPSMWAAAVLLQRPPHPVLTARNNQAAAQHMCMYAIALFQH